MMRVRYPYTAVLAKVAVVRKYERTADFLLI